MRQLAGGLLAAMLMNAAFAFPWNDELSGTIKRIDPYARLLVFEDDHTYSVERGINLAKFKAGDKVTFKRGDEDKKNIITKLTKDGPVNGSTLKPPHRHTGNL